MRKIEDINFDNIDLSKYQKQISEIQKDFLSLKSDKIFMWKFNRYKKKKHKEELKFMRVFNKYKKEKENVKKRDLS